MKELARTMCFAILSAIANIIVIWANSKVVEEQKQLLASTQVN